MTTQQAPVVTEYTDEDLAGALEQVGDLDQEITRLDTQAEAATEEAIAAEETAEQEVPEDAAAPEPTTEPTTEPAPATTQAPTAPNAEETRLRQENTRLKQETQDRQQQAEIRQRASDKAQEWTEGLVREGWDPDHARQYAESAVDLRVQQFNNIKTAQRLVALEENVPPEVLDGLRDEVTMRQKAQQHKLMGGPQREELDAVKRELAQFKTEMKKSQIPAQSYNQASGARGSRTAEQDLDDYNAGIRNERTEAAAKREYS